MNWQHIGYIEFRSKRQGLVLYFTMGSNSPKKFCAICVRENGRTNDKFDQIRQVLGSRLKRQKDQDLVQVTEPHWLRRGNLKPTDLVCRPHLAILMRGMDYGCEGGCASPLHRGARICNPKGLRIIPPDWKSYFYNHPKIIAEDKFCMLLCWGCYKSHMEKMSRFGNPMGRILGRKTEKIQRSKSLSSEDFLKALNENSKKMQENISKFKSLHNVHSIDLSTNSEEDTGKPSSSPNSPLSRRKRATTEMIVLSRNQSFISPKAEVSIPSLNHKHRGRKIPKGRRSPSPPISLSPIRSKTSRRKVFQAGLSQSFSSYTLQDNSLDKLFEDDTNVEDSTTSMNQDQASSNSNKTIKICAVSEQKYVEVESNHNVTSIVVESSRCSDVETDVNIDMVTSKLESNLIVKELKSEESDMFSKTLTCKETATADVYALGSESDEMQYLGKNKLTRSDKSENSSSTSNSDKNIEYESDNSHGQNFGIYEVPSPNTSTRSVCSTSMSSNAFSAGDMNRLLPLSPDKPSINFHGEWSNDLVVKLPKNIFTKFNNTAENQQAAFINSSLLRVEIFRHPFAHLTEKYNLIGQSSMSSNCDVGCRIIGVDFLKAENMDAHRTSSYIGTNLVVRRGQEFDLEIEFSQEIKSANWNLSVEIVTGANPMQSNGTRIFLSLSDSRETARNLWKMKKISSERNILRVSISPPSSCTIGKYGICFEIESDNKKSRWKLSPEDYFILLFNPWCVEDAVFLNSVDERNEYVLEDVTCTFHGNSQHTTCRTWILGQFDNGVLDFCFDALGRSSLRQTRWKGVLDVVKVIFEVLLQRTLNQNDIKNIFNRRSWFFNYFAESNENLNFRNCILICSALRCLGIPSRIDIGMNCCTSSDLPLIVNKHYDEDGHSIEMFDQDDLRPQYGWVAVWVNRIDVQPKCGGWQAIANQPSQIKGPSPVTAIKNGQVSCGLDTDWFYSLLNACVSYHKLTREGKFNCCQCDENVVGELIITKAIGERAQRNITDSYKVSDGEDKLLVHQTSSIPSDVEQLFAPATASSQNINVNVQLQPRVVRHGDSEDVDLITMIQNNEHAPENVFINIEMKLLDEFGNIIQKLQYDTISSEVPSQDHANLPVQFNWGYWGYLMRPDRHIQATAFVTDKSHRLNILSSANLSVEYPNIDIQVHGEFRLGGEITLVVRLRNSLPTTLRNCSVDIESSTLITMWTNAQKTFVQPEEIYKCEKILRCRRAGQLQCVVKFLCESLNLWKYQEINIPETNIS